MTKFLLLKYRKEDLKKSLLFVEILSIPNSKEHKDIIKKTNDSEIKKLVYNRKINRKMLEVTVNYI